MICSRCGHQGLTPNMTECPNCGLQLKLSQRAASATGTFRALSSRRKMLTQRHYALPFPLGEEIFGRFKARDLLGQGPTGVVYQVTDERGDAWALKVLHERWREGLDLDAFQGELTSLDAFESPALCTPKEVIVHESAIGLLLPLQGGLTLRKLMALRKNSERAFKLSELTQLLQGVHAALSPLHKEGLAHGGLKAENIFMSAQEGDDEQQLITLSDARLSAAIGLEVFVKAQRATGVGHAIAPEVARGDLTPASDVYSLGALLFEALSKQSMQGGRRPLTDLLNSASLAPLDALLDRALSEDPTSRYSDIDAMMSAFAEVSVTLSAHPDSPFSEQGTNPGERAPVSPTLTESTNAAPINDPLLGKAQALTPAAQTEEFESLTVPLSAQLSDDLSPPPIPLSGESTAAPAAPSVPSPPPLPTPPQAAPPPLPASSAPVALDPISELERQASRSPLPAPDLSPRQERAPQPIVLNPSSRGPWLLNSTLGFMLSAVVVVGGVASSVYYVLSGDSETQVTVETPSEVKTTTLSAEAKAKAEAQAKAQAEAQAKAQAEAEAQAKAQAEAEAEAQAKAQAEAEAQAKAQAEAEAQAKAKAKAQAKPPSSAEARAEARAKRAAEREAKAQAKREAKEKRDAERKAAREAKAQAKRDAQAKRAAEREAKAQAKRDAQAKLKTNVEAQASASKRSAPEKGQVQESKGELRCPAGMIARATKRMPRGSLRGGRVRGAKAVAMAKAGDAYCIDAYEYPGRGQLPKVNINHAGAQALCAQVNKRLCTDQEWRRACGGTFPYGKYFSADRCNTEDAEGEERKLSPAGSFKSCRSAGIYDMSGNASEWTADKTVRGGYYASADEEASCGSGGRRSPSSKRGYIGFRCCADFK